MKWNCKVKDCEWWLSWDAFQGEHQADLIATYIADHLCEHIENPEYRFKKSVEAKPTKQL